MGLTDLMRQGTKQVNDCADDIDFVKGIGGFIADRDARKRDGLRIERYNKIETRVDKFFHVIRVMIIIATVVALFLWK